MRYKRKEITRLKEVLEKDRKETTSGFSYLFEKDLTTLLNEYFDFSESPVFDIKKTENGIVIEIKIEYCKIKNFNEVPN